MRQLQWRESSAMKWRRRLGRIAIAIAVLGLGATAHLLVDATRWRQSVLAAKESLPSNSPRSVRIESIVVLLRDVRDSVRLLEQAAQDSDAEVALQAQLALKQIRGGR
jgi:hypothetical protein